MMKLLMKNEDEIALDLNNISAGRSGKEKLPEPPDSPMPDSQMPDSPMPESQMPDSQMPDILLDFQVDSIVLALGEEEEMVITMLPFPMSIPVDNNLKSLALSVDVVSMI